jgi:LCP family protein required for cell wall assembly
MQKPQGARPRARSPFAAAFLSLLFPGLGHLYLGAPARALAFAAAPVLVVALMAGVLLRMDRLELVALLFSPFLLTSIFILNLVALLYRLVAIIDAYRVAEFLNAHAMSGDGRLGKARLARNPLSAAGLLAIVLVMAGSHVVVARYDMLALDALTSGCIFIGDQLDQQCANDPSEAPGASASTSPDPSAEVTPSPTPEPPSGSQVPEVSIPPWDGKQRLNILLIGADEQGGGHNTDTLITVSIDPVTKQVAMFSIPRDTVDLPVPPGNARRVWGSAYDGKINSFFVQNRGRSDLWPGNDRTRGYNALKAMIGELYDLDVKYFVEVNFNGFKKVVDAVGGVTINVQVPVVDDAFPGSTGRAQRLYIPSGIQHMDGEQALRYARSRNTSSDFDRGARQQRVLLSLREQADPQILLPRLPELVEALKSAVRTDIPLDQLDELLGLASGVDTANIRSYVFGPPYSQDVCGTDRGCIVVPNTPRIKEAVKNAFTVDPADQALRERLAGEGGGVWVLNGTGETNRGARLAGYLEFHGLAASAPRQKPEGQVPAKTVITVYNGAETKLPETMAYLEKLFGVTAKAVSDSAVRTDVVIVIGRDTPDLEPPPSS